MADRSTSVTTSTAGWVADTNAVHALYNQLRHFVDATVIANSTTYRTGAVTDAVALQAAADAALAAGGGDVFAWGAWSLNAAVTFGEAVNLKGAGSSQANGRTVFTCTTSGAGIHFGTTTAHSGGESGGFAIDGGSVATQPFYVGQAVGRTFFNIDVRGSAGTGFALQGTANCQFRQCNTQGSVTDGWQLDRASGNKFDRCEGGSSGRYNLNLMSASTSIITGNATNYPTLNVFTGCFFEYHVAGTVASVHQSAGLDNMLSDCLITSSATPTTAGLTLVQTEKPGAQLSAALRLRDCTLQHNFTAAGTVAFDVGDNTTVICTGTTKITLSHTAVKQATNGAADFDRVILTSVTTWATGAALYLIRNRPDFNTKQTCTSVSTVVGAFPVVDPLTGSLLGYTPIYSTIA